MINQSFVFPVLAAAAAAAARYQVYDTLQYHTTAPMPLHSLSVLCRTLMLNGLALVDSCTVTEVGPAAADEVLAIGWISADAL